MITILQKNNEWNKINDLGLGGSMTQWKRPNYTELLENSTFRHDKHKIHMRKEALSYKICNQF